MTAVTGGGRRPPVALGSKIIQIGTVQTPFLGQSFGALPLVNQVVPLVQGGVQLLEATANAAEHGHASHVFYPAGNDQLHIPRGDGLGGEMDRLLAGATHPIQADAGHRRGQSG